jgi:hypothetical protein
VKVVIPFIMLVWLVYHPTSWIKCNTMVLLYIAACDDNVETRQYDSYNLCCIMVNIGTFFSFQWTHCFYNCYLESIPKSSLKIVWLSSNNAFSYFLLPYFTPKIKLWDLIPNFIKNVNVHMTICLFHPCNMLFYNYNPFYFLFLKIFIISYRWLLESSLNLIVIHFHLSRMENKIQLINSNKQASN